MSSNPISARDAFAQTSARRQADNPWTAADEARLQAKRQADQEAWAKWNAANPQVEEADEADEEDES